MNIYSVKIVRSDLWSHMLNVKGEQKSRALTSQQVAQEAIRRTVKMHARCHFFSFLTHTVSSVISFASYLVSITVLFWRIKKSNSCIEQYLPSFYEEGKKKCLQSLYTLLQGNPKTTIQEFKKTLFKTIQDELGFEENSLAWITAIVGLFKDSKILEFISEAAVQNFQIESTSPLRQSNNSGKMVLLSQCITKVLNEFIPNPNNDTGIKAARQPIFQLLAKSIGVQDQITILLLSEGFEDLLKRYQELKHTNQEVSDKDNFEKALSQTTSAFCLGFTPGSTEFNGMQARILELPEVKKLQRQANCNLSFVLAKFQELKTQRSEESEATLWEEAMSCVVNQFSPGKTPLEKNALIRETDECAKSYLADLVSFVEARKESLSKNPQDCIYELPAKGSEALCQEVRNHDWWNILEKAFGEDIPESILADFNRNNFMDQQLRLHSNKIYSPKKLQKKESLLRYSEALKQIQIYLGVTENPTLRKAIYWVISQTPSCFLSAGQKNIFLENKLVTPVSTEAKTEITFIPRTTGFSVDMKITTPFCYSDYTQASVPSLYSDLYFHFDIDEVTGKENTLKMTQVKLSKINMRLGALSQEVPLLPESASSPSATLLIYPLSGKVPSDAI